MRGYNRARLTGRPFSAIRMLAKNRAVRMSIPVMHSELEERLVEQYRKVELRMNELIKQSEMAQRIELAELVAKIQGSVDTLVSRLNDGTAARDRELGTLRGEIVQARKDASNAMVRSDLMKEMMFDLGEMLKQDGAARTETLMKMIQEQGRVIQRWQFMERTALTGISLAVPAFSWLKKRVGLVLGWGLLVAMGAGLGTVFYLMAVQ